MGRRREEPKVKIEGLIGVPLTAENMVVDFMVAYVKSYSIHLAGVYLLCLYMGGERGKCYDKTVRYAEKLSEVATRHVLEYVKSKDLSNRVISDLELEDVVKKVMDEMGEFMERGGEGGEAKPQPSPIYM